MNKKLLAIAVGAAVSAAPMFATAGVKVYGHAQIEVGTVDDGTGNETTVDDNARGRLGVKASEKLGNGMTALAKYEWRIDTDNDGAVAQNGTSNRGREAMVGLKGGFGTIEAGNLKSAYKYSGGVKYDPFVATLLQARGNGGMTSGPYGHNSFLANNIGYKTPKMGGFSGWVTFSPEESGDVVGRGADGDYSFGLKFKQKSWEAFVAGINNDDDNYDGIKIGGQMKFGNIKVSGQYEMIDNAGSDVDVWFLGGQFKFGANVLVAQFGNTEPDVGSDTDYYTIGLIHNMSKKTRVTAGFSNTDGASERDAFAVGLRMKF